MALKLKEIEYKKFLLEKGERVGLYAAGGIALLMIVLSLFLPGKGFFSGSPKKRADEIVDIAKKKRNLVQSKAPQTQEEKDALSKADPQLLKKAGATTTDPDGLRINEVFAARDIQLNKRRNPSVLAPVEFLAQVVPAQVETYVLIPDKESWTIGVLVNGTKSLSKPGKSGNVMDIMKGLNGPGGRGGRPGGMGFPGMPQGYDPRMRGSGAGGGPDKPGVFGDDKKNVEIKQKKLADVGEVSSEEYARDLRPLRMAVVAGAFPYKQQVEEFRRALRLGTPAAVLQEVMAEKDKKDNDVPAFHFLGFLVKRRTVGPDGKPSSDWQDQDVEGAGSQYRNIVFHTLKEFAPEDQRVQGLLVPGLYMKEPVQVDEKPYPKVEEQLPKIADTIKALESNKVTPAVAPNPKFDPDNFSPFGGAEPPAEGAGNPSGGVRMAPPPRGLPPMPGAGGAAGGSGPAPAAAGQGEWAAPDYCVFRFLDVNLKPGETYEYRFRIRMSNPNYKRPDKDIAYHEVAVPEELLSDWVDAKDPQGNMLRVRTSEGLHLYAVDEQAVQRKDPKKLKSEYKGINANKRLAEGQVVVQVHRWLDYYVQPKRTPPVPFPVGDWVVGERLFATRGEYVGQEAPAQLPYWSAEQKTFLLLADPAFGKTKPAVRVQFGAELPQARQLLVDFDGGTAKYQHVAPPPAEGQKPAAVATVTEPAGTELLLLSPDGKLLAHASATDEVDETRVQRVAEYEERVKAADPNAKDKDKDKPAGVGK